MKDLKNKAINIKGKSYILVKDRVVAFNSDFPNGSITTELVNCSIPSMVVVKATVTPDVAKSNRTFTGFSQSRFDDKNSTVNQSSALENAETSAVGRALAMMGIGVIDSIASVDELSKAGTKLFPEEPTPEDGLRILGVCSTCGGELKPSKYGSGTWCPTCYKNKKQ